ncbi:FkbM family methyltransferase [Candidatus Pelagibacter sp.]|nr:FkbM family methyltransferase [Candidatus Pelagibacter sp.]
MIKKLALLALGFFDFLYQRKIIQFLKKKNLTKFDIFFDVGGHKGESIDLFLSNFTIKKIISFEASPINFKFLEKNREHYLKKFIKTEIVTENIALGSENKDMIFRHFGESSSSTFNNINEESSYFKRKFKLLNFLSKKKLYETIKVKIETLYDYMESNNLNKISFLKIDTEGYEYEILKGLKKKINYVDTIMFEHHYDNMIIKNYTFTDINFFLKINNFKQIYKSKMPFRKTFEYIYKKRGL